MRANKLQLLKRARIPDDVVFIRKDYTRCQR